MKISPRSEMRRVFSFFDLVQIERMMEHWSQGEKQRCWDEKEEEEEESLLRWHACL